MPFTKKLWDKIKPSFQEIVDHPFNVELTNGSLDLERFQFYIHQDALYFRALSEIFGLVAQKAHTPELNRHFLDLSSNVLIEEQQLRSRFLSSCKLRDEDISPTCRGYSHYLKEIAKTTAFEVALVSFLPCFWIYKELSQGMAKMVKGDNPYFDWIRMTSSPYNNDLTDHLISTVDKIAATCSAKVLALMEEVVERCTHFEWHFWDDAYKMKIIPK